MDDTSRKKWMVLSPNRVLYWRSFRNHVGLEPGGEWVVNLYDATRFSKETAEALAERVGGFVAAGGDPEEVKNQPPLADLLDLGPDAPAAVKPEPIGDGGPAFPAVGGYMPTKGMTLRDYFAGQALAGLLANLGTIGIERKPEEVANVTRFTAERAYQYADAMITARNAPRG